MYSRTSLRVPDLCFTLLEVTALIPCKHINFAETKVGLTLSPYTSESWRKWSMTMAVMSETCCYFLLSVDILYSDAACDVRELKQEYIL